MSASSFPVAAIQMVSCDDIPRNLEHAAGLMADARDRGAELIVLPENFGFMGLRDEAIRDVAELPGDGPMQSFLAEQAARLGVVVVGGSVPIRHTQSGKVHASSLVMSAQGDCLGRYDKIHLFDVDVPGAVDERYKESDHLVAGERPLVVETSLGRVGVAICYDLRFPELFRRMVDEQVDFIALPAAFTLSTGRVHWETLIRARAIENQVYMVASAQGGRHFNERETFGHSMIVGPWGDVLDVYGYGRGYALASVDLEQQRSLRQDFPVLGHRRL